MTWKKILSWILLAAGGLLIFLGGREFFYSRFAQSEEAASWRRAARAEPQSLPLTKPGESVARLWIPRLGAEMFVVEGTGAAELRRGPGHVEGTALPGRLGNCVIAGHRDTHFRVLKDIRKGDEIILETPSEQYLYRVTRLNIASPKDTWLLAASGGAVLNLITCYPFYYVGPAPKRFIVHAELAGSTFSLPTT